MDDDVDVTQLDMSTDPFKHLTPYPVPPLAGDDPNEQVDWKGLQRRTLSIRRTVNMTRKGKVPSMSALVIVGNGNGAVGYGEGKAEDVAEAVRKAAERARKNMVPVMRYDARTVYHDIQHKYKATKITLRARPPGFGNRANRYIHEICKCVGIQDISAKVLGSRNPINVVKGAFEALQRQRAPETLAKARGLKVVDVQRTFYETA